MNGRRSNAATWGQQLSPLLVVMTLLGSRPVSGDEGGGTITGEVAARSPKHRANVLVNLEKVPGTFRPPAKPAEMNQKGMQFVPHVLAILKGTTVRFLNEDSVSHNVFSPDHEKYNLGSWPKGETKPYTFKNAGIYHQLCNVHPEMGAIIAVFENPFFSITGTDGKFEIKNVPPGTYAIHAWGEKFGEATQQVTVASGGTATLKFEAGK